MKFLIILVTLFICLAVLGALLQQKSKPSLLPYIKRRLLSPAEESFFKALSEALENEFFVFPKIRLADLIEVRKGLNKADKYKAFNRIQSKHIDFVIVKKETLEITWAVELDDSTHERPDRKARDTFIDEALNVARIEIKHFRVKRFYDPKEIKDELFKKTPTQNQHQGTA